MAILFGYLALASGADPHDLQMMQPLPRRAPPVETPVDGGGTPAWAILAMVLGLGGLAGSFAMVRRMR